MEIRSRNGSLRDLVTFPSPRRFGESIVLGIAIAGIVALLSWLLWSHVRLEYAALPVLTCLFSGLSMQGYGRAAIMDVPAEWRDRVEYELVRNGFRHEPERDRWAWLMGYDWRMGEVAVHSEGDALWIYATRHVLTGLRDALRRHEKHPREF